MAKMLGTSLRTKRRNAVFGALVLGLAVAACGSDDSAGGADQASSEDSHSQGVSDETIKIGTVAGTGALDHSFVPNSIRAYASQVNADGGVAGRNIELVHCDDEAGQDPARTVSCVRKLVEDDKVFALVGPVFILSYPAVKDYLEESGIPVMVPDGVHPDEHGAANTYHANTDPADWGRSMARFLVDEQSYERISVLYLSGLAFADVWFEQLQAEVGDRDAELVSVDDATGVADCESLILAARKADPDVVVLFVAEPQYVDCVESMRRQSWEVPVVAGESVMGTQVTDNMDHEFMAKLPVWANSSYDIRTDNPAMEEYKAALEEEAPGSIVSPYGVGAWIGAQLFHESVEAIADDAITWENLTAHLSTVEEFETGFLDPLSYTDTRSPNDVRQFYSWDGQSWQDQGSH